MLSIIEKYVIIIILYYITLLRLPQWLSSKKIPAMQETIPAKKFQATKNTCNARDNPSFDP